VSAHLTRRSRHFIPHHVGFQEQKITTSAAFCQLLLHTVLRDARQSIVQVWSTTNIGSCDFAE
jgi:hypothetical protein